MILRARHHRFVYPFFKHFAVWLTNRKFKEFRISGNLYLKKQPLLLIANHVSWWDGFWAMYVNVKILHKKFHFMMLEEQLRKYWYFNYAGGFSVNKKKKSILETLSYTSELLNDNDNMVLMFPQGKIQTLHNQDFTFERGLSRLIKDQESSLHIVFMVNLIDYFSDAQPSVYCYLKEYNLGSFTLDSIQKAYNIFYRECVERQKLMAT